MTRSAPQSRCREPASDDRSVEVPADDRVIARAFKISSAVLLALAAAIAAGVMVLRPDPEPAAITADAVTAGPRDAAASAGALQPPHLPFRDVTASAGVDFEHVTGAYGERLLPETMGAGVAFLDYDNDGDPDLLFANGRAWPWQSGNGAEPSTAALYRNRGDGTFANVTAGSGLDTELYGMGIAVGDVDGDGYLDVFLSALGRNRLFRNMAGERFEDVTDTAGVAGSLDAWSTGAAFLDYDRDGDLDLFVGNYVEWSRDIDLEVDYRLAGIGRAYGPPTNYAGTHSYLYRNEGGWRFTDVSAAAGIGVDNPATGQPAGKALAVVPLDVDEDGWPDLFVANDTVGNFLFRNRGDGRFVEDAVASGVAFDASGRATGAMGVDFAHFRNDAELALAIGNFANEMSSFYVAQAGSGLFTDEAAVAGIGPATRQALTFGVLFLDVDLDGRLDLLHANGHIENDIHLVQASQRHAQPPQLFWNCGFACSRTFVGVPADRLGDLGRPLVGRGAAYADVDRDGDLDLAITQAGGRAVLYRNEQALGHHWLRVRLVGAGANSAAIGARIELRAGDGVQRREVQPSRGYLSQVELPVTFGLGGAAAVDSLTVHWPSGGTSELRRPAVDRVHVIREAPE